MSHIVSRGMRYLRLLPIIQKLSRLVLENEPELRELARKVNRSAQLQLYDEFGEFRNIWIGVENGKPVVKQGTYPATNTIKMHVDVFLDILTGKIDFRQAVAHGVIEIQSHDGLPWFYHMVLWSMWFDKLRRLLE